jgi:hypothetical protein
MSRRSGGTSPTTSCTRPRTAAWFTDGRVVHGRPAVRWQLVATSMTFAPSVVLGAIGFARWCLAGPTESVTPGIDIYGFEGDQIWSIDAFTKARP